MNREDKVYSWKRAIKVCSPRLIQIMEEVLGRSYPYEIGYNSENEEVVVHIEEFKGTTSIKISCPLDFNALKGNWLVVNFREELQKLV